MLRFFGTFLFCLVGVVYFPPIVVVGGFWDSVTFPFSLVECIFAFCRFGSNAPFLEFGFTIVKTIDVYCGA